MFKNVKVLERPGYFGKKRVEKELELSRKYGVTWEELWQVNDLFLRFNEAVLLYDRSYLQFLYFNPADVEYITSFGECYDSHPNNIKWGSTHSETDIPRHIQDTSIRRALLSMGVYFKKYKGSIPGLYTTEELLHVRGEGTNGHNYAPMNIPFCDPQLILKEGGPLPDWCKNENSVEAFWQRNKVIGRITQGEST